MSGMLISRRWQTVLWIGSVAIVLILAACGSSSTPTPQAIGDTKDSGTGATLMEKIPGIDAMMGKTPGTEATTMEKTPGTDATMMEKTPGTDATMMEKKTTEADGMMKELPGQIFAPHLVNFSPVHGEKFQQAPDVIVINFNFNLQEKSSISVMRDGAAIATGKPTIDSNQLAIRAALGSTMGDGLYVVSYKTCWPDASCHDGSFAFQVDSKTASAYQDMTANLN